ncbi:MAG TPA: hypothetical protein VME20_12785 [Acidimicrobiales bacterium]|nr:hypothetical protein [Acidimicrobiales bacterium]
MGALEPAWYAAGPGKLRDWLSLLHPPYTAWHLSYVLIGASLAPRFHLGRLLATLAAFALAVGVGAHGLDELKGRPLRTAIPAPLLAAVSLVSISAAVALGVIGIYRVGWGLAAFILVGLVLVVGYNLEIWHGRLHGGVVFALGWGSFPLLTAYYAQASSLRASAVLGAVFAYFFSRAQRALSTEARDLRRRVVSVAGERVYETGTRVELTRDALLRPLEQALVALSWCTCVLGAALVVARTGY